MIRIFISYSHADEALRQELDKHLASLKHQGIVEVWHDRRITAGDEWAATIDGNLKSAHVILLLISADFIASRYCYDVELKEAMGRHEANEAVVIPVVLRPCDWRDLSFGKLQGGTKDGKPITKFSSLDDGFLEVVQSIKVAAMRLAQPKTRDDSRRASGGSNVGARAKPTGSRSSNLHVKKNFSDHDRDKFRVEAFEYIASFFEGSLAELEERNRELKSQFRRRDANAFEATVYLEGKQATRCGIWLSTQRHFGEIGYSSSGLGDGSSCNESLSVADDGQMLGLRPLGMAMRAGRSDRDLLTLEGAAEYYWSAFVEPLQR